MAAAETVDADLPKALVKRIVKAKLSAVDTVAGGDGTRDFQVNKDALLAFCEAGKVFIHYLTATANDVCKEAKRQTISADDVLTALDDLEFGDLVPPLREALEAYRAEAREKNKKKAEQTKKRKADKEADGTGGGAEAGAAAEGEKAEGEEQPGEQPAAPEQQPQQQQGGEQPAAEPAAEPAAAVAEAEAEPGLEAMLVDAVAVPQ